MGISIGLPPSFSTVEDAAVTRGSRESRPLPRARRLTSVTVAVMVQNPLFRKSGRGVESGLDWGDLQKPVALPWRVFVPAAGAESRAVIRRQARRSPRPRARQSHQWRV